ncbi:MAG: DUF892 family protein [Cytophagales bacterium]|nr:DUF892 family protein [Armatimonadota bacterium]
MTENTQQRLIRYLNDSLAMEKGGLVSLKDMADRARNPEIRALMTGLAGVASSQIERLGRRITELGGSISVNKAAMNALLAKGNRLTNAFHDQADIETQEVAKAYGLSHFEIAAYTSLSAYSRALGDQETAALADSLVAEERHAADQLHARISPLAVLPLRYTPAPSRHLGDRGETVAANWLVPALLLGGSAAALWAARNWGGNQGNTSYAGTSTLPTPRIADLTPAPPSSAVREAEIEVEVIEVVEVMPVTVSSNRSDAILPNPDIDADADARVSPEYSRR